MSAILFDFGIAYPTMDEKNLIHKESQRLLLACKKHPNIQVIELGHLNSISDIIVIERTDESIFSRNKGNIKRAKERVALVYNPNLDYPYEVRPLRKDFPDNTGHQFHTSRKVPNSLCLYSNSWATEKRTWTPERHLDRIFWWLKKASENQLHGDNQPLEQLYYTHPNKILLPSNFHSESLEKSLQLKIKRRYKSWYEASFVSDLDHIEDNKIIADTIVLEANPVVTGMILGSPDTLGELCQQLNERGLNLIDNLKESILSQEPKDGFKIEPNRKTFIFVNIPITRVLGGKPEKTDTKCYVLDIEIAKLGIKLGILFKEPSSDRVYKNVQIGKSHNEVKLDEMWKDIAITPFEVKSRIGIETAQLLSGLFNKHVLENIQQIGKFKGVLAGVGALGSTMAEIWSKECWGEWTYIDDDILEPHNIIRHTCKDACIGFPKAAIVSLASDNTFGKGEGKKSKYLVAKINNLNKKEVSDVIKSADLLIDATTTLDAPRDLSLVSDAPRMVSVFLTPSGKDSVLLFEDQDRNLKLSSLESQYYRAILNNKWGKKHLIGNKGTVVVGTGCRDSSFIISYELIQLHGALLARQVRSNITNPKAQIKIWSHKENGSIRSFSIPVHPVATYTLGQWSIVWDNGLTEKISAFRNEKLPNETGGVLLGYTDQSTKIIHVVDVIPAPNDSQGSRTTFLRGWKGMKKMQKKCQKRTANIVDYIGEWHSHPVGVSSKKSVKDIKQLEEITTKMKTEGLPAVMAIVADYEISLHLMNKSVGIPF